MHTVGECSGKSPWCCENAEKGGEPVSFIYVTNYSKCSSLEQQPFPYLMILQVTNLGASSWALLVSAGLTHAELARCRWSGLASLTQDNL